MPKGVAFPVCVSVNECVCNVSPLRSDDVVSICVHGFYAVFSALEDIPSRIVPRTACYHDVFAIT